MVAVLLSTGCAHRADYQDAQGGSDQPAFSRISGELEGKPAASARADGETVQDINTRAGTSGSVVQSGGLPGDLEQRLDVGGAGDVSEYTAGETSGSSGGITVQVRGSSALDRSLAQQITQELRSDTSLSSALSTVSISIDEGRVTLRGTVHNEVQRREIETAVQRTTGVSSVDNQLQVGTTGGESFPYNPDFNG